MTIVDDDNRPPPMVVPDNEDLPCHGGLFSVAGHRDPGLYDLVIDQFRVTSAKRYMPRDGKTYCNYFARDVMEQMGAPLPAATANVITAWLGLDLPRDGGWNRATQDEAVSAANAGQPALATFFEVPHGHIAVVRPGNAKTGPVIAQAGKWCFSRASLSAGFGKRDVSFWVHP